MVNYFILHGSFGSPFNNWIPYLRGEIEALQKEVYTPDMPTGVGVQTYDNWQRVMQSYVDSGRINENTVIFAHSIAPVFICKFLVMHKIKVKRLVFVCGFNHHLGISEEYDSVNESMFCTDLEKVKEYCQDIVCFYTDNDPYVPYEKEKEFADMIASKQIMISGGGHLNAESEYVTFEQLLEYL